MQVLVQMMFFMGAVCIRKITAGSENTSITYVCWYARNHPDPSVELLKNGQLKKNFYQQPACCL